MTDTPEPPRPSPLDRLAELFDQAVALASPAERAVFVARVGDRDPALAHQLEALLEAHFDDTGFLEGPLPEEVGALVSERLDASLVGRTLGSWRVDEVLHHGGMGTVYRAERVGADFQQSVALKVIRVGYESPELIRRFALERQVLARLEHPHIARLLDGGTTDDGLPFLVMEFVPGEPVDRWYDRVAPSVDQVLDLFQEVAGAVHYAHQNLVIHRDIKPSNILVTPQGTAKLLDFGIAKLLQAGEGGVGGVGPDITQLRMMTPAYSSPEQYQGAPVGIATDVYSLGVLLYRLLTGEPPYRISESSTAREAERLICETMPLPPSERLPEPDRRRRRLRGDLDTIVLKALRKEPERRYGSVLSLMEDLERFRAGLPVSARPDTVGYRTRRFLARNWLGVGAAAAIFLALGVGLGAALWQAGEAQRQRDVARAEAVTAESAVEFLKTVFWSGNPWDDTEPVETVDDVLRYAEEQVDPLLGDQPVARAYILAALAEIAAGRGELERSLRFSEDAVRVVEAELSGLHPREPMIQRARALALHEVGDLEGAREAALAAVAGFRAQESPFLRGLAEALNQLGALELDLGEGAAAEAHFREALAVHETLGRTHPASMATVTNNLAVALMIQPDRLAEAEEAYAQALALARSAGASPASQGTLLVNQANALWTLRRRDEAEAAYLEAVEILGEALGPDHPSTLTARTSMGNFHEGAGELTQAVATLRPVLEAAERTLPPDHFVTAYVQNVLAVALCRLGGAERGAEGLALVRASLATRGATLPEGHWALASGASVEGRCLMELGRVDEAVARLRPAVELLAAERGEEQELTQRAREWLAEAEGRQP